MSNLTATWWENDDNTFQFQVKAANHEALVTSGRYNKKSDMLYCINLLKAGCVSMDVKEGKKNKENI